MQKTKILAPLLSVVALCASSCGEQGERFLITWKNDDGTLLHQNYVTYGKFPHYYGPTPTKAPDDVVVEYAFKGWKPDIVPATTETTYFAYFEKKEFYPGQDILQYVDFTVESGTYTIYRRNEGGIIYTYYDDFVIHYSVTSFREDCVFKDVFITVSLSRTSGKAHTATFKLNPLGSASYIDTFYWYEVSSSTYCESRNQLNSVLTNRTVWASAGTIRLKD